jgi:hypothetical protein
VGEYDTKTHTHRVLLENLAVVVQQQDQRRTNGEHQTNEFRCRIDFRTQNDSIKEQRTEFHIPYRTQFEYLNRAVK